MYITPFEQYIRSYSNDAFNAFTIFALAPLDTWSFYILPSIVKRPKLETFPFMNIWYSEQKRVKYIFYQLKHFEIGMRSMASPRKSFGAPPTFKPHQRLKLNVAQNIKDINISVKWLFGRAQPTTIKSGYGLWQMFRWMGRRWPRLFPTTHTNRILINVMHSESLLAKYEMKGFFDEMCYAWVN